MGVTKIAYFTLGRKEMVCSLGEKHKVKVYGQKVMTETIFTDIEDWWGYGESTTFESKIWKDVKGNYYNEIGPFDYYGGVTLRPRNHDGKVMYWHKPDGFRYDELEV